MASLSSMFLVLMIAVTAMAADWQANPKDCGKTKYKGMNIKIVGGHQAKDHAWPWQVAMFQNGSFICGGSLIDPWWVMTAAHCVTTSLVCNPEVYTFRVGSNNLTDDTHVRQASRILVHPKYDFENNTNFDNDIALFKMNDSFSLSKDFKVNTICLPTGAMDDQFVVGQKATVTGWGNLNSSAPKYPEMLYEAVVPIYDWKKCNQSLGGKDFTKNMMCAGLKKGGVDSCTGDSGGPLVAYPSSNTAQYFQIGIVSWGSKTCGEPNFPGVYTNVTRYEDWIRSFFKTPTQKYMGCVRDETQKMSKWTIAFISVFVMLAISIVINVHLGKNRYRQNKKGSEEVRNDQSSRPTEMTSLVNNGQDTDSHNTSGYGVAEQNRVCIN